MKAEENEGITQADRLADAIADCVLSGEFAPGLRLDEGMLAERYGVSRTPVREALRQLASTGLIEVKPRRGAMVAKATSAELEKLFGAMAEIEATCSRLAAMGMTPIERRRLQNLHDAMGAIAQRDDRDAYAAANVSFHTQIYLGAHNEVLADIATGLRRRVAPFRARAVSHGSAPVAVARGTRRGGQSHHRLRPGGRARRHVSSHEPG